MLLVMVVLVLVDQVVLVVLVVLVPIVVLGRVVLVLCYRPQSTSYLSVLTEMLLSLEDIHSHLTP